MNWLRRAVRRLMPARPEQEVVMGTCPGFVWDDAAKHWVSEEITWQPGRGTYSMLGPVYRPVGLQP
jgi:hypothetical protein